MQPRDCCKLRPHSQRLSRFEELPDDAGPAAGSSSGPASAPPALEQELELERARTEALERRLALLERRRLLD